MTKNLGGRPLLFETVEELKEKIEAYFNECLEHPEEVTEYKYHVKTEYYTVRNRKGDDVEKEREVNDYEREPYPVTRWRISLPKRPTVTGLAVYLNTSRQTLLEYEGEVEGREKSAEFADTIKKAKDLIEMHWEDMLQGNNVTGVIFNLKNNFSWADRSEQIVTSPDGSMSPYGKLSDEELRVLAKKNKA